MDESRRLVAKAQRGNEEAFGELVKSQYESVYRLIFQIVRNDADAKDLSQQTWIKVWKSLRSFRSEASFQTWVYRIATFTAWDFLGKRTRQADVVPFQESDIFGAVEHEISTSKSPEPNKLFERKEIMEHFQLALNSLSEKHRTALVLREIEGLSYGEIARIMNCRTGTVMSRIFNARKRIQTHMKDFR